MRLVFITGSKITRAGVKFFISFRTRILKRASGLQTTAVSNSVKVVPAGRIKKEAFVPKMVSKL